MSWGLSYLRALKSVKIKFRGKVAECAALFDTGSGITAIRRSFFEKHFGTEWSRLDRPLKLYWINGESIIVDKYANIHIVIDDFELPEVVFIVNECGGSSSKW